MLVSVPVSVININIAMCLRASCCCVVVCVFFCIWCCIPVVVGSLLLLLLFALCFVLFCFAVVSLFGYVLFLFLCLSRLFYFVFLAALLFYNKCVCSCCVYDCVGLVFWYVVCFLCCFFLCFCFVCLSIPVCGWFCCCCGFGVAFCFQYCFLCLVCPVLFAFFYVLTCVCVLYMCCLLLLYDY